MLLVERGKDEKGYGKNNSEWAVLQAVPFSRDDVLNSDRISCRHYYLSLVLSLISNLAPYTVEEYNLCSHNGTGCLNFRTTTSSVRYLTIGVIELLVAGILDSNDDKWATIARGHSC